MPETTWDWISVSYFSCFAKCHTRWLTKLIMIVPQNAAHNPVICKVGRILATKKSIAMFITRENRPKVRIIAGRANIFTIGRKTAFTSPIIVAAIIKSIQLPRKEKPERSLSATKMAVALANMCIIRLETELIVW